MSLRGLILQLIVGLSRGSILFLLASGLTLIFGVNRVLNFAHGSLYLLGMYISFSLSTKILYALPFGFWISLILAPICVAAIGAVIEVVFFRRIYEKEHLIQLVLAFALIYILSDAVKFGWGVIPKTVDIPNELRGFVTVASTSVPIYYLFIIIMGITVGALLWVLIYKTGFGRLMRASAGDSNMTRALGVKVDSILTVLFALGSFLAGFAGALNVPTCAACPGMDVESSILAFIIVIIGGPGSVIGAAGAALSVGIVEAFGIMFVSRYTIVLIYFVMVVVLIMRPYGFSGRVVK